MIAQLALLLGASTAHAAELRPVRPGDTVEAIATELGDPALAAAIREANGIAAGAQPTVGTLLALPDPSADHGQQRAFLISITGRATITDASGSASPATTFSAIADGSTVCTSAVSYATLRLASTCNDDGSLTDDIQLDANTCLTIDSTFSTIDRRATVVRVTRGSVRVSENTGGLGHVTVVTASGLTTGVNGGYRVTVEPTAARTEALYADVAVQGAGEEVALAAGQGSRTETGKPPSDPVSLLVSGRLDAPEDGATLRRPTFRWAPVDDAFGYRIEIAPDPGFVELLFAEDVAEPVYDARILMLPYDRIDTLYWRVSTFDRFGFLGIPSEPRSLALPEAVR